MRSVILLACFAGVATVSGHAVIAAVNGDNGVTTTGFGVIANNLRNGTDEQPFQIDTSVLKDLTTDPCGATLAGGSVDITTNMAAVMKQGSGQLPALTQNLSISMNLHQVNADGGGPFTVMVNTDATGKTWTNATVTQQAPGSNGLLRAGPNKAPFTAQLLAGTQCTGGPNGNACLIRLSNGSPTSFANGAGPFGGCLAVQMPGGSSNLSGAVAASASSSVVDASTAASTSSGQTQKKGKSKTARSAPDTASANNVLLPTFRPPQHFVRRSQRSRRAGHVVDEEHVLVNRDLLKSSIHKLAVTALKARALALTAGDLEDLKTATGTAIDIPIDALAGKDDAASTGGNSTSAGSRTGAILTAQQATDVKEAVKEAIAASLAVLADQSGTAAVGGTQANPDDTALANADARAQIDSGATTTINAGNAGVGFVNKASVQALIGALTAIDTSEAVAGA